VIVALDHAFLTIQDVGQDAAFPHARLVRDRIEFLTDI